mmetsp:Transcript_8434/g.25576  ORF Transcript_8434/g.25576 Transcript_8434/m.25576 type:complete len:82 (-) Transcript_8434:2473-2718(-)
MGSLPSMAPAPCPSEQMMPECWIHAGFSVVVVVDGGPVVAGAGPGAGDRAAVVVEGAAVVVAIAVVVTVATGNSAERLQRS